MSGPTTGEVITTVVNTPTPIVEPPDEPHASLAGQAIHDAARAEVHAENAEKAASEALTEVERITAQCQTLSERMTSLETTVLELSGTLEATRSQLLEITLNPPQLPATDENTASTLEAA